MEEYYAWQALQHSHHPYNEVPATERSSKGMAPATEQKNSNHETKEYSTQEVHEREDSNARNVGTEQKAIWDASAVDPVLAKKMAFVNAAIDEIGMTRWHWKLFLLNGFGYAVDSLLIVIQSITQMAVTQEFGNPNPILKGVSLASQIGMLVGAAAWGLSADVIGRKFAFNSSLFIVAVFVLIAGGMPSYVSFCAMVAIYSAAAGGGYIIDATNFHEFLPRANQWLVTFLAIWVPAGYLFTGLLAWAFLANFSCPTDVQYPDCHRSENMGWRYLHFTCGGVVLLLSLIRVFVIKMVQTPRWLIAQNRDEEVIDHLSKLAETYNRPFTLTLETLQAEGRVLHTEKSSWSGTRMKKHLSGLFETKLLAYSTILLILNWVIVGLVTPLYQVFLPYYLASRGYSDINKSSTNETWRNYTINQAVSLLGPCIAASLIEIPLIGRKGTLAIGALLAMAFQFAYTQISTPAQNVGISSAIGASNMIYYATIYAYTPEILPSAHRGTGYGVCVVMNRVGGVVGVVVGSYANVETSAPLFVCAACFGVLAVLSLMLPFESRGRRGV